MSTSPVTSNGPLSRAEKKTPPMPSITCTNCGAVLKTQTAIPAGKKVKCPKCTQPFVVQAAAAPEPAQPEPNPFATDADDSGPTAKAGDETEKSDKGDAGKKKSKTGLIIGIVAAVLLLCCCPASCTGIYFAFSSAINTALGIGDAAKKAVDDAAKKAIDESKKK